MARRTRVGGGGVRPLYPPPSPHRLPRVASRGAIATTCKSERWATFLTEFYRVFREFYLVWLGFTWFWYVFTEFYFVSKSFYQFLPDFTISDWVSIHFTRFYWVLPSFYWVFIVQCGLLSFERVSRGLTLFQRILSPCNEIYRVFCFKRVGLVLPPRAVEIFAPLVAFFFHFTWL